MKKLSLLALLLPTLSFASGFLGGAGSGGGGGSAIGGVVTGGTQYSVLFIDPTATLAEDPTKFGYDIANTRFCLGCDVSTATNTFHLLGTARFESFGLGIAHLSATGVLSSSLIVNADVDAAAAIAYSKLNLTGSIVNADVNAAAAIAYSKLALSNSIVTGDIVDANVTNAKLADMAAARIKGRAVGAGTGVPTDLTGTQATAILDSFVGDSGSGGTKGLVPAPASGDASPLKYLAADGTWKVVTSGFADPMTTRGDLIYRNPSNVTARLGIGGNGTVLSSDGTDVSWQTPASGFADPMTTRGDIIIRNASNVTARLARGAANTFLKSDGTDVAYSGVNLATDVGATVLPLANGGTNAALTAANGAIPYSSATAIALLAPGTAGQVLTSGGAGAPTWGNGARPLIFGSRGTPRSIVAATGITSGASHMSTTAIVQKIYVEGSVAGDSVALTITAGTIDGQEIILQGRNNSNTVTLDGTTTNVVVNGSMTLGADDMARLSWDGTNWVEMSRSN